jgi:hypothetical protein
MRADRRDARRELREASLELARLRRVQGAYRMTWRRIARARRRISLAAALVTVAAPVAQPAAAADPVFRHGLILDLERSIYTDLRSSPTSTATATSISSSPSTTGS